MSAKRTLWIWTSIPVILAFIPFKSLNCPSWDVWVTDGNGKALPGMTVLLTYQDYSAESRSHEIRGITDAQGHVAFAAQTLWASVVQRIRATLNSTVVGVHGRHAQVFAFGNGQISRDSAYWTGKPNHMESRIIVVPRPPNIQPENGIRA